MWLVLLFLFLSAAGCGGSNSSTSTGAASDAQTNPDNQKEGENGTGDSKKDVVNVDKNGNTTTRDRDLRADPSQDLKFPNIEVDRDSRTITVEGDFSEGEGKRLGLLSETIIVPDDGRSFEFSSCQIPLKARGRWKAQNIVVDGSLTEWPKDAVVGYDRAGDVNGIAPEYDLVATYFASDDGFFYLGVEVQKDWIVKDDIVDRLIFNFNQLELSLEKESVPSGKSVRSLEVFGNKLWERVGGKYGPVGTNVDHELAVKENRIELKIAKKEIEPLMAGKPFSIDIETFVQGTKKYDRVGPHLVGLTPDYSCAVPIPSLGGKQTKLDQFKLIHFMRHGEIPANRAEMIYRAMLAAIPTVTFVAEDSFDSWDTINVIAIEEMAPAGLFVSSIGMFLEDDIINFVGEKQLPTRYFYVAAHEYAHGLNAMDYRMALNWVQEGHSNWIATKALGSFFGPVASFFERSFHRRGFLAEEQEFSAADHSISNENWGKKPHSPLFYYNKSETLLDMLVAKGDYTEIKNQILVTPDNEVSAQRYKTTSSFIDAVKALPGYKGSAQDSIQPGWFAGQYQDSIFNMDQLKDSDKDGLADYYEKAFAWDPLKVDSDEDGYTDSFEHVFGLDPLSKGSIESGKKVLLFDNDLSDWDRSFPDKIVAGDPKTTIDRRIDAPCTGRTSIKRFGVVANGDWLFVGVELTERPIDSEKIRVVAFLEDEEANKKYQMIVESGDQYLVLMDPDESSVLRGFPMLSPFNGKTVELALNAAWLGWSEYHKNLKIRLGTFHGDKDQTQCDLTDPELRAQDISSP